MTRKTKDVTIAADNRDKGKMFRITEMGAEEAEDWAFRALQALAASGVQIPENPRMMSAAKLAEMGLMALAKAEPTTVKQLKKELLACVEFVLPDNKTKTMPLLINAHIEEVATIFTLQMAALELHIGFSLAALPQISG